MTRRPSRLRLLLGLIGAGAAVLLVAAPASAHVTVNATDATPGGFTELAFRVPTESDTASTTKVAVYFPADHPLAFVSVKPHPGWSFRVTTTKLAHPIKSDDGTVTSAVSRVVWTADSKQTALEPGEYDDFDVSAGPLPDLEALTFKAIQTYSDGTVVRWIDEQQAGQPEPEHPAPTLSLRPITESVTGDATSGSGSSGRATVALVVAVVALVAALGSVALRLSGGSRRSR